MSTGSNMHPTLEEARLTSKIDLQLVENEEAEIKVNS
jgi:hypothetical protein